MPGGYDDSDSPARSLVALAPSDAAIQPTSRGLWVGTGGNITLRGMDDVADVVLKNIPNGTLLPVRASHVRATGTTATDLVLLR